MFPHLNDYFHFTLRERRGIFVLITIIVLELVYLSIDQYIYDKIYPISKVNQAEFQRLASRFNVEQTPIVEERNNWYPSKSKNWASNDSSIAVQKKKNRKTVEILPNNFDPNTVSHEELKRMGLSNWQIRIISNYREKGGRFRQKSDFKKIYGISDTLYIQLKPFILLPDTIDVQRKRKLKGNNKSSSRRGKVIIDINIASAIELQKLKGIGKVYSNRIVKYRKRLNGFVRLNQLKEVYGISDTLYQSVEPFLKIDSLYHPNLSINSMKAYDLSYHPYITWDLALLIENYRTENGSYSEVKDLLNTGLLNLELYSKIAPYLSVDTIAPQRIKN